jgi:cytochrome P450 family 6
MVDDFIHFHDRGLYCDAEKDPYSASIFAMSGEEWKSMRNKLTPVFSSGKLKNMFQTFLDVGIRLEKHLMNEADQKNVIEAKGLFSRFVVDISKHFKI